MFKQLSVSLLFSASQSVDIREKKDSSTSFEALVKQFELWPLTTVMVLFQLMIYITLFIVCVPLVKYFGIRLRLKRFRRFIEEIDELEKELGGRPKFRLPTNYQLKRQRSFRTKRTNLSRKNLKSQRSS